MDEKDRIAKRKEYYKIYSARPEVKVRAKKYYEKNRDKILKYIKRYRLSNPDRFEAMRKKRESKPNRIARKKEYKIKFKLKYPEKVKQYNEQAYIKRMSKGYFNKYIKDRKATDLNFKLRSNLRIRLNEALKGKTKADRTMKLVGCYIEELKQHLESQFTLGMNWKNYGYGWHIDHIKPCALFNLALEEEQKKCFHYSNLQPMWAIDNIKKSSKV